LAPGWAAAEPDAAEVPALGIAPPAAPLPDPLELRAAAPGVALFEAEPEPAPAVVPRSAVGPASGTAAEVPAAP
jgi:hypothetical protein